jgi:hypothetical protein
MRLNTAARFTLQWHEFVVTYLSRHFQCRRQVETIPLCKIEFTLPRIVRSRGECTVAVLSMNKHGFSRLDVLMGFSRVVCVSVKLA